MLPRVVGAVSWAADRLDIFALGTDRAMYHKAWTGSAWEAGWDDLGGAFTSPPAVVAWGPNRLDIVGLGTDRAMYHKAWTGSAWEAGWDDLGGAFTSPPAVVAWGPNRLDIVGLGTDRAMYHKAWTGSAWEAGWDDLGGAFTSPPAVVAWGPNRLDIVGLGTDRAMYHKAWTGSAWEAGWDDLGGAFTSPPAVVAWGPNRLDIVGLGTDRAMYHKAWTGSAWEAGWDDLGGAFTSPPAVVAWGPNRLDIVGLGTDRAMYHKAWTGSAWEAGWDDLGGAFTSPPAVVAWGPNRLDIVGLGTDRAMYHKAWTGSAWEAGWDDLGGAFYAPFGPGPAQLLVIAPDEFMAALQPLVTEKNGTNLPTIAVSISSLVPLFRGIDDPETIKNAIQYAHENLSTQYVMLVGDAHCVPVRYYFMHDLSTQYPGNPSVTIPMDGSYIGSDLYYANLYHHLSFSPARPGTPDNWDESGNGLYNEGTWVAPDPLGATNPDRVDAYPDVAVGRVPAHTAEDVTTFVNKIIQYEFNADLHPIEFTFVADQPYPTADQLTGQVISNSNLMNKITPGQINRLWVENPAGAAPPQGWTSAVTADVVSAAARSSWVSYIGHGGPHSWGYAQVVLGDPDVQAIASNNTPPLVFAAGCSTGRFCKIDPFDPDGAEYIDTSGNMHNFTLVPGATPGGGPVITDTVNGQQWGVCQTCHPLPLQAPTPNAYDYDQSNLCLAYPWLIGNASGGAIAYFGEVGIAEDPMGAELEGYLLAAYVEETNPVPILGDLYLSAQQKYWANHQTDNGTGGDYHSVSRFYLGWMVFFGDPSLRLPPLPR